MSSINHWRTSLYGKRFGDWLVTGPDEAHPHRCMCKCACGTVRSVVIVRLRHYRTSSCGCTKRGGMRPVSRYGKQYGPWTVLCLNDAARVGKTGRGLYWDVRCVCGKKHTIRADRLLAIDKRGPECKCSKEPPPPPKEVYYD